MRLGREFIEALDTVAEERGLDITRIQLTERRKSKSTMTPEI